MARQHPKSNRGRVLILGPHAPPSGGVVVFLQSLFDELIARDRFWYGYSESPCEESDKLVCVSSAYDPGRMLWRDAYVDVVLDSASFGLEYPRPRLIWHWIFASLRRRVRWLKIVHDVTIPDRFRSFSALQQRHVRLAARFVWRYIAVNAELGEWLSREVTSPDKVMVIPSSLSAGLSAESTLHETEFDRMRESFDHVICVVGAMNEEYGFRHVVEAASRLQAATQKRYGVLLLCTDFAQESGYRDSLAELFPHITVLVNVPHAEALAIFGACDVVVRAVRRDSYGLSRVEAICQGTPVVATRSGETRGMLCYDFGDIDGLTRQLEFALAGDAQRQVDQWARVFRQEAKTNLKRLMQLIDEARNMK